MTKRQWLHVARTVLSVLIGLAPFAPELVAKLGLSTTAGVGAGVIAVAAAVTRLTQVPTVETWLRKFWKM